MDPETNNMRRVGVVKELPRPKYRYIIAPPDIVSSRKFENDTLFERKARLVARGCIQVSGVDDREACHLETLRTPSRSRQSSTLNSVCSTSQQSTYMETSMKKPIWNHSRAIQERH